MSAVEVRGLRKSYGEIEAVRGVDLDVHAGETFGFLGPKGAGKSTTIKILCTLAKASGGSARVAGYDVSTERDQVRRHIRLVFQDTTLDGHLTAELNLRFHAELHGMHRDAIAPRLEQVLRMVGLWERRTSKVMTFSGGMKRRLEIARGLMHSPRVLFLDEPTVGLDPQTRASIWEITIFLTTHYMDEAEHCDRIAIIDEGKLVALDTPAALEASVAAAVLPARRALPADRSADLVRDPDPPQPADLRGPPDPHCGLRAPRPPASCPAAAEPRAHLVRVGGAGLCAASACRRPRCGAARRRRAPVPEGRVGLTRSGDGAALRDCRCECVRPALRSHRVTPMPVLLPTMGFDEAAQAVLTWLTDNVPLAFWSVTRVENGRQTYLFLDEANGYGLPQGGSHAWEDSFCVHMASGAAPAVAPDAQAVPLYAAAGVNAAVTIGSYAGAPVTEPGGQLFGAICGIDPKVRNDDPALVSAGPVLQLFGQLLTMVLAANRMREAVERDLALARSDAETDSLTGLLNRRGWERCVAEESARFGRLGDPTVVAMIDLDRLKVINDEQGHDAGDAYIRAAGAALAAAVRGGDVVARLGGDEFGVLMTGCTEAHAGERIGRLYTQLEAFGVAGSVGWAPISVLRGFPAALAEADEAMYAAKRARRARRAGVPAQRDEQPEAVATR